MLYEIGDSVQRVGVNAPPLVGIVRGRIQTNQYIVYEVFFPSIRSQSQIRETELRLAVDARI